MKFIGKSAIYQKNEKGAYRYDCPRCKNFICANCYVPFRFVHGVGKKSAGKIEEIEKISNAVYGNKSPLYLQGALFERKVRSMEKRVCLFCGEEIYGNKQKKYCSLKCNRTYHYYLLRKRLGKKTMYDHMKIGVLKEKEIPTSTLDEVVKKAELAGMSYGKYVSQLYLGSGGVKDGKQ